MSLWKGGNFAVNDGGESRLLPFDYLMER
jgi:hypothetical protein